MLTHVIDLCRPTRSTNNYSSGGCGRRRSRTRYFHESLIHMISAPPTMVAMTIEPVVATNANVCVCGMSFHSMKARCGHMAHCSTALAMTTEPVVAKNANACVCGMSFRSMKARCGHMAHCSTARTPKSADGVMDATHSKQQHFNRMPDPAGCGMKKVDELTADPKTPVPRFDVIEDWYQQVERSQDLYIAEAQRRDELGLSLDATDEECAVLEAACIGRIKKQVMCTEV